MFGKTKSCIKAINNGQNFYDSNRLYPIKPPNVYYSKAKFYQVKTLIKQGYDDRYIYNLTKVNIPTIIKIRNGEYDNYLTCND